jgi:hypothetical protein
VAPREAIGLVLFLLVINNLKIALPIIGLLVIVNYIFDDKAKKSQENNNQLLQIEQETNIGTEQEINTPNT